VKRMTTMLAAALSALLVFSAVAVAAKPNQEAKKFAQQQCKAQKKADKGAFKAYHGERAMRTCKKDAKDELKQEFRNAAQECKEERSDPNVDFEGTYGSNKNGKNALGKCVSSKVKDAERGNGGRETS
jgi:hypothetical protein